MRLGDSEIHTLEAGTFKLDGGAMFGSVPKTMWEKAIPPDSLNRIPMALRLILFRDLKTGRNLLVDTGIGHKVTEKFSQIYCVDYSQSTLEKSLSEKGLGFDEITDVFLTHLHFDHTGGSTKKNAQGQIVASFPRAKYYIQKANFDWATKPNSRESASYLPENFMPLVDSGQLIVCEDVKDFESKIHWPAISARLSFGHTIGLACPLISVAGQKFFYPSDLIPTASHVPLPWVMGYDIHVIKILEEKEAILEEAVKESWIFVYEHDPKVKASRVVKGPKHFSSGEVLDF